MPAYVVVDIRVTDQKKYDEYIKAAPATLEPFGGQYLVRGGRAERLEGSWTPNRVVILKFDTYERAKEWWDSEVYEAPKLLRQSSAVTNMIVVEGTQ